MNTGRCHKALYLGLYLGLSTPAWGQQCSIDPLAQYLVNPHQIESPTALHLSANALEGDYERADFSGDVQLNYQHHQLQTQQLSYFPQTGIAHAPQSALYGSPNLALSGHNLRYDSSEQSALIDEADYVFRRERGAREEWSQGKASHIHHQPNHTHLHHVHWSSCGRINPTWHLESEHLHLDHAQQRAFAENVSFKIKDFTLITLPYFSYPIGDERQSGWLAPSLSSSSTQGLSLRLPYYFNLAPNYDATLTLHPMSKRGLMLEGEGRYLGVQGQRQQSALVYGNWIFDRHERKNRWHIRAEHQWEQPNLQAKTLYQSLSDARYAQDFDLHGERYADSFLVREFRLDYEKMGRWQLLFQDYLPAHQEARKVEQPYARLPQLRYQNHWQWQGLSLRLNMEATQFYRQDTGHSKRFDALLDIRYRLERSYAFLEPRLQWRTTHYHLSPRLGHRHHRTLPTFSLDSGLIFERLGSQYTQTLEPRLFYVYTPYQDQSALPLFDTDERHKNWAWLFATNRFTGADRIGDTNQLTTALTSRWIDRQTGEEKALYQIGQVQYLRRPRHHLSLSSLNENQERSLLVAHLKYKIHRRLSFQGLAFHNTQQGRDEYQSLDLRYEIKPNSFVQLSRRFDREHYHQYGISSVWQWNDRYTTFARLDYSHTNRQFHNLMLGIEFNDCCLSWRLVGKHYRKHPSNNEKHNALYLEFVFKGLGSLGNQTTRLLQKDIHGFQP
ncbi:MAG: LPS assembly protein LptD [Cardiobacteriaceae bacterium]|nr:LPS assembly protein LptD [Cardiobacteriaceae bacterium]